MFGVMEALLSFIRRQVGLRTDAGDANGSLHGKVKKIVTSTDNCLDKKVSQSGIKSVQRGVYAFYSTVADANIPINTVNPAKCFVNLHSPNEYTSYDDGYLNVKISILKNITSDTLIISGAGYYYSGWQGVSCSWEVIEFY